MKKLSDYLKQHNVTYQDFIDWAEAHNTEQAGKDRLQFLAAIEKTQYAIKFTFENDEQIEQLFEHDNIRNLPKALTGTPFTLKI